MTHRAWIAVIMALLAGLALGSWAPRMDMKHLRKEVDDLRKQAAHRTSKSSEISMITTMLKVPETTPAAPAPRRHFHHTNAEPVATTAPATNAVDALQGPTIVTNRHETMKESLATAKELWETRTALARNSFISNIKASPEQTTNFDVLVEAMNLRIGTAIDKWAAALKTQESIQPEQGIRMVSELSGIMVTTYDEMDRKMPADWRKNAGEDFQLFNFIDPDVATPLVELEDRFAPDPNRPPNRGPRPTGRNRNATIDVK